MKTTLNIPAGLIESVMKITGARTKSDAVKKALEEVMLRCKIAVKKLT